MSTLQRKVAATLQGKHFPLGTHTFYPLPPKQKSKTAPITYIDLQWEREDKL